jgi:hypothetical protein
MLLVLSTSIYLIKKRPRNRSRLYSSGLFVVVRAQSREQNDIADSVAVGEQHHQTVDTDTLTGCWWHTVFQSGYEVSVIEHRFIITRFFLSNLCLEAFRLIFRIVQLREAVRQFTATDEEFKTVGDVRVLVVATGQW